MKEAQIAVEVMERLGTGEDTASEVLAALLGDNRVPGAAGAGARFCGPDPGLSAGVQGRGAYRSAGR